MTAEPLNRLSLYHWHNSPSWFHPCPRISVVLEVRGFFLRLASLRMKQGEAPFPPTLASIESEVIFSINNACS